MAQKTEGIEASRLVAAEQNDGSLHVTLVIPPRDKAAFFSLFAELGTPLLLCPAARPTAQTIAPAGDDMAGAMGSGEPEEIGMILRDPRFQAWVEEQAPNVEGVDAVVFARTWLAQQARLGPSGYADRAAQERIVALMRQYASWHKQRYGDMEPVIPA